MLFSTLYHSWYKYGTKINKITINTNKPHINKRLAIHKNNKSLLIKPNRSLSPISNFYFPMQNVKLNHYIAVFERVVLLCKICEQQTSNRIESLAIESGCIRE